MEDQEWRTVEASGEGDAGASTAAVSTVQLQAIQSADAARAATASSQLADPLPPGRETDAELEQELASPPPVVRSNSGTKIKKRPPLTPSRYRTPRHTDGDAPGFSLPRSSVKEGKSPDAEADTESTCTSRSDATGVEEMALAVPAVG